MDWLNEVIVVRVKEGPQFTAGEIVVTGAPEETVAQLRKFLSVDSATIGSRKGAPVSFAPMFKEMLISMTRAGLEAQGYRGSSFSLSLDRDPMSLVTTLRIEVQKLGKQLRLKGILFEGTFHSPQKAIQEYLGIQEGMVIKGDLGAKIYAQLEQSANFPVYSAALSGDGQTEDPLLLLHLEESPDVSEIGKPLNPVDATLMKTAEWLNQWKGDRFDLDLNLSAELGTLRWAMSSSGGGIFVQKQNQAGELRDWLALVVTPEILGLYHFDSRLKFTFKPSRGGVEGFGSLNYNPDPDLPEKSNRRNFLMGLAIASTNKQPVRLRFSANPIVLRSLATHSQIVDGVLSGSTDDVEWACDAKTGLPLRFFWTPERPGGGASAEIGMVEGALADLALHIAEASRSFENAADSTNPLKSAVMVAIPFLQEMNMPGLDTSTNLMALAESEHWTFLRPIGQFGQNLDLMPKGILTPSPDVALHTEQGILSQLLNMGASAALGNLDKLFEPGTWPSLLARETLYFADGQPQHVDETLNALLSNHTAGPLAHLAMVKLLRIPESPASSQIAKIGLTRLTEFRVLRELQVLTQGDSVLSQTARHFVRDLESLPVPQWNILTNGPYGPEITLIQTLRKHPTDIDDSKLSRPVLDALVLYFEKRILDQVRERLLTETLTRHAPDGRVFQAGDGMRVRRRLKAEELSANAPDFAVMTLGESKLNEATIDSSVRQFDVEPGKFVFGEINIGTHARHGENTVYPFAWTPNWRAEHEENDGERIRKVHDWIQPGFTEFRIPFGFSAPEKPGIYYLIFHAGPADTPEQLMAGPGSPAKPEEEHWNDGNGVADWSAARCEEALSEGRIDGLPATCIRIVVRPGQKPPARGNVWKKRENVATNLGGDWTHFVKRVNRISLAQARAEADRDPSITHFFHMKKGQLAGGGKGPFRHGDAVFFSGAAQWGSSQYSDGYAKE